MAGDPRTYRGDGPDRLPRALSGHDLSLAELRVLEEAEAGADEFRLRGQAEAAARIDARTSRRPDDPLDHDPLVDDTHVDPYWRSAADRMNGAG